MDRRCAVTWVKTSTSFPDELADLGVSDTLYRTHHEVLTYLYNLEKDSCRLKVSRLSKIATSPDAHLAAREAVDLGLWRYHEDDVEYELVNHADVLHQSLAAQRKKRTQDAKDQARARQRADAAKQAVAAADSSPSGSASVTDSGTESGEPHTTNQYNHTTRSRSRASTQEHYNPSDPWSDATVIPPGSENRVQPEGGPPLSVMAG